MDTHIAQKADLQLEKGKIRCQAMERDKNTGQESGRCMKELVKTSRMGLRNGKLDKVPREADQAREQTERVG